MTRDERPLGAIPLHVGAAFALLLGAHLWMATLREAPGQHAEDLPPAPQVQVLRLAAFGETPAIARAASLALQGFDQHAGNTQPFRKLNYGRLTDWLRAVLDTDPKSGYPLFLASRLYAEVSDPVRCRQMLEFIHGAYLEDPNRRWPALAHATLLAKHRLRDLPLARRYAAAIDRHTTAADVPLWARQMEIFILEDMDELEAARIMLGGLIDRGKVGDAVEARFLGERLREIEQRLDTRHSSGGPR